MNTGISRTCLIRLIDKSTHSRFPSPENPAVSSVLESLGLGVPEIPKERLVFTARAMYGQIRLMTSHQTV
jgi:hypothetical protein